MRKLNSGLFLQPVRSFATGIQSLYQRPPNTISGIDYSQWYSPMQPTAPFGTPGTEPREFQTWSGQNLFWTPRIDAEYSAADLKSYATYPLARMCIENVKDVVTRSPWEIQLRRLGPHETRESLKHRSDQSEHKDNLLRLNRFFECPDGQNMWPEWLSTLLDDVLVIDAGSILIRKTFKQEIAELRVIRGEMIVRYIDENGFLPKPPNPAYAQNWWGLPLVNLTTDQLVYKPRRIVPRNTLSSQLYGMSPTESIAKEIELGIERLRFRLAYYKEGSVPGVIQVAPRGTSPERITEAMDFMNSELAGNLAARMQWRVVQGFAEQGQKENIIFSKQPLLTDLYEDTHIRTICFPYGVSPQRLQKMIRTEAKANQEAAKIEGMMGWIRWVKSVIDYIIQRKMGLMDYEIAIDPYAEADPLRNAAALTMFVKGAIMTPNEGRARIGEEMRPEPEADRLGVITGTGFVPIGIPSVEAGVQIGDDGKPKPHTVVPTPPPPRPNGAGGLPKDHNAARGGTPPSQEAGSGRSTGRNAGIPDGKEPLYDQKLAKRHAAKIEPDVLTPDALHASHQLQASVLRVFERQYQKAIDLVDTIGNGLTLERAYRRGSIPLQKALADAGDKVIYFMRHGKTGLDSMHRSDGFMDFPLSDEGRKKLITSVEYMQEVPITAVYHPDLKRAKESGELMSSGSIYHPPLVEDNGPKTWNLGTLTGKKKYASKAKVLDLMEHPNKVPEGGESRNEFRGRFMDFVHKVESDVLAGEGPVLVVMSGSNFRELSAVLFNGDTGELEVDEGGMVEMKYENGDWKAKVLFGKKKPKFSEGKDEDIS